MSLFDPLHGRLRAAALLGAAALLIAPSGADAQKKSRNPADKLSKLIIRHRTRHYAIAGTVPAARLEEFGRALEYIHAEYQSGFNALVRAAAAARRGRRPPTGAAPEDAGRFRVIVFASEKEYHAFGDEFLSGATEHSTGLFHPGLEMLLILDQKDVEDTYGILFHEAFHQFLNRYILSPPMWLNEGVATYYGSARPTRGGLVYDRPPKYFWDMCRRLIQRGEVIPLAEVVTASREDFYDPSPMQSTLNGRRIPRRDAYYAESYTLVHMLLSDREGRRRLQDYVRELAEDGGAHSRKITAKYFDATTCQRLSGPWARHVQSRPENR